MHRIVSKTPTSIAANQDFVLTHIADPVRKLVRALSFLSYCNASCKLSKQRSALTADFILIVNAINLLLGIPTILRGVVLTFITRLYSD